MTAEETETDIIIDKVEEIFSVSTPVASNPRLISIAGVIPSCNSPAYWLFEKFLWTLIDLDKISNAPITLFINSCGGDADSFFSFYDFTAMLKSPVYTVTGKAESAGALMFILGTKGHRYIFPSAHVLLHGANTACRDCEKEKCETKTSDKLLNVYNKLMADIIKKCADGKILNLLPKNFTKTEKNSQEEIRRKILSLLSEDLILTAEEAIKYGLADHIITPQIFAKLLST